MMKASKIKENGAKASPGKSRRTEAQDGTHRKKRNSGDRPSTYTEALGLEICERLINGETLDSICSDPHMPESRVTVFRWRRANAAFDQTYLAARSDQLEALADQVIEIAETEQDIQRARVKLDARRIVISRLSQRYAPADARAAERPPFDIAGAIEANRKKMQELIAEVGWERAERIRQDEIIDKACNPNPEVDERIIRGNQRVALHLLEQRKAALLAATPGNDKPI